MTEVQHEIWYAGPTKVRSALKLWALDDGGSLRSTSPGMTFCGENRNIQMPSIQSVSLVRQTPPWLLHLIIGTIWATLNLFGNSSLFVAVGLPIIIAFISFLFVLMMPWVRVDFVDQSGVAQIAYFADGSQGGWGGMMGGTHHLHRWISDLAKLRQPAE
ncbi:MAG: hypothetical protein ACKVP0_00300 [Pirellulaceae bacterium]